jgi:glycosyltransferase involved in cell wall biosynthesis
MSHLKVLVSAYSCRPGMGSEPGVGWNTAKALSKYHQVWVLTRSDNRPMIEAELKKHFMPSLNFVYCDLPGASWWKRGLQGVYLHYYLWQIVAYFVARRLHQKVDLDVIHHVTYVRYSSPSFLALLPVPFVWGPVGGGEVAPKAFWQDFSLRGKVYEILRAIAHRMGELDPFTRLTVQRSFLVRATTEETAKRLHLLGAANVQIVSESCLSESEIEELAQCSMLETEPVRFVSMARLLHWKGLHLGLKAFAQAKLPENTEYWILGEGPEQEPLQRLAEKLGVTDRVKLLGRLPRDETLERLRQSHVLVHPSLHDSGGWVCIEAMATGRPIICLNLGGSAVRVTENAGFKIPAQAPEQAIEGISEAMTLLACDAALRSQMGKAGQLHVKEFYSWELRALQLNKLYQECLTKRFYG